jgi:hypothetical protein
LFGGFVTSSFVRMAAVVWLGGCTLVSDFDVRECAQDDECTLPTGAVQHCQGSVCEQGCRNNLQCISIDPRYPICTSPGGQCVALTDDEGACSLGSEYSDATMGSLTADQMSIVGAFAPRLRSSAWLTVQLAATELTSAGLFAARPLLVIVCGDTLEQVPAAIEHLDRLGAAAILAPPDPTALRAMVSLPAAGSGRLFLSPGGYLPGEGAEVPSDRLWYVGPSYAGVIEAFPPLVAELAARAEARRGAPARIAVVTGSGEEEQRLARQVRSGLVLNGQDATRLENEDRVHPFTLDDFADPRADRVAEIAAYAPDLVLWFASGSFGDVAREERSSVVQALEALASARTDWQPVYLFGPRNTEDAALRSLALDSATFRARSIGLRADRPADPALMTGFFERFEASFPSASAKRVALHPTPSAYDAFYYLSYVRALSIVSGSVRHLGGPTEDADMQVAVGPAGFDPAARLLSDGIAFELTGTSGPLTFGETDHARSAPVRTYCWTDSAQLEDSAEFQSADGRFAKIDGRCAGGPFDGD